MVIALFIPIDKEEKPQYYKNIFLQAHFYINVILKIQFSHLSNVKIIS